MGVRPVLTSLRWLALAAGAAIAMWAAAPGSAATLPPNFQESTVFSGLSNPTTMRFAPDGRVFVAEKNGRIKTFDSLNDATATVSVDLSTNTYNFWDRGMLGMAIDPNYPTERYIYVLYAYDADIGGLAPKWGTPGVLSDPCPPVPGATADGCVISGRLSRIPLAANGVANGPEQVLIGDWCQQYPSHSVGQLAFGSDGALYVSGGDGASFNFTDWGQDGSPVNPCGDPPGPPGTNLTPPTAQGRRAAEPGSPHDRRPDVARRHRAAHRQDDGRGLPRQPARLQLRPQRPADRRARPAKSLPSHGAARNERRLGRRRRLEQLGGGQPPRPGRRPDRRQLRLALLRGQRAAERLRRGEPQHLREPLQRGPDSPSAASLHLQPRLGRGQRRELPDRRLVDLRPHLLRRGQLPGELPRRALLRRLLARLHLGDAPRWKRPAGCEQSPDVRRCGGEPGRSPNGPERRRLLRRFRRRNDQAHPFPRLEQRSGCRGDRQPDRRGCAAHGQLRRHGLE